MLQIITHKGIQITADFELNILVNYPWKDSFNLYYSYLKTKRLRFENFL